MDDSKPSGTQTVVQNNSPWGGQQPYLTKGFERAESDILNKPTQYYPNSTVVPFSNQTTQALGMQENRALSGSPVMGAANQMAQGTLQGNYLNANPHLNSAIDAATRPMIQNFQETVLPGIQSGFAGHGRYGSGLQGQMQERAGEALTRQIGDVAGAMSYQNYGDERQRMLQAGTLAPTYAANDYNDIAQLAQVGQTREAQAGANLQDDINRYYQQQQAPKDALAQYMSMVAGGSFGGQSTQQSPIYSNPVGNALGMGATAAGIAGTLFGQNGIWPQ